MSTALSVIAKNTGASQEDIKEVVSGMIVSAKAQHGAVASNAELAVVMGVCSRYNLNPLVKECAAFISGGKLSVVVMVDGWYRMVNDRPDFDGVDFDDTTDENGKLLSITCKMYIKNRSRPVCVTEYMIECYDPKSSVWKKWPNRMLRHKAYIQCARMAFGYSGVIDPDEKDRIESNQPAHQQQQPKVSIDYDAIERAFAECADEETLKQAATGVREQMQAGGAWEQSKAHIIAMHVKHKDRILADYADTVVNDGVIEPEPDIAFDDESETDEFGDSK